MATIPEAPADGKEREYPESWIWDEDGDHVSGRFVRFDQASTRDYGKRAILVLHVDGVPRSIWLNGVVLLNRVRDEVASRVKRDLDPGERVSIRRLEKTKGEGGRQGYWKFQILFPDRPEPSVSQILDLDGVETEPESKRDADDGIPF
jgi:hypothetical protein